MKDGGMRALIWLATIGAVVLMFWPLVGQLLATVWSAEPSFY